MTTAAPVPSAVQIAVPLTMPLQPLPKPVLPAVKTRPTTVERKHSRMWSPEVTMFNVLSFISHSRYTQEDENLTRLVKEHGAKKWTFIAGHLPGRKSKQCRERCVQYSKFF